ncbi:DUF2175 domain-containing protein [Candidatus Thalassolituus haligoni]|uniref:DUF2175 domain-containing protein n=1 Tax=Candidatus Thalassolituus haligoni TaxID=3100113 RepID=UPI00351449ED|tara:strand:+ start:12031 stop:12285 length:255 start_codon:yes stop_codon:yes gene_type:complete
MSLNCVFCQKVVFGSSGQTVPGMGPAHAYCYQAYRTMKRTFKSMDITQLTDVELADLKDLVLAEENDRKRKACGGTDEGDIELF